MIRPHIPVFASALLAFVGLSTPHVLAAPRGAPANTAPATAAPSAGTPACSLVGTWSNGRATFTFDGRGTFTVRPNPASTIHGTFTYEGGNARMTNTSFESSLPGFEACIGVTGTYAVTFDSSCSSLTLGLVSDSCALRARGANGSVLRKQ